jgi:hypothetical protein
MEIARLWAYHPTFTLLAVLESSTSTCCNQKTGGTAVLVGSYEGHVNIGMEFGLDQLSGPTLVGSGRVSAERGNGRMRLTHMRPPTIKLLML